MRLAAARLVVALMVGLAAARLVVGLVGLVGLKGCLGWRLPHSAACVIGTRGGEAPDDLGGGEGGQASCGGEHGERHGEWEVEAPRRAAAAAAAAASAAAATRAAVAPCAGRQGGSSSSSSLRDGITRGDVRLSTAGGALRAGRLAWEKEGWEGGWRSDDGAEGRDAEGRPPAHTMPHTCLAASRAASRECREEEEGHAASSRAPPTSCPPAGRLPISDEVSAAPPPPPPPPPPRGVQEKEGGPGLGSGPGPHTAPHAFARCCMGDLPPPCVRSGRGAAAACASP